MTQFREWVLGNISVYKDHPALGGYYGCDDCCHTSIAIEHNYGSFCQEVNGSSSSAHTTPAGPGSVTGCPSEYYSMAEIRREILKADPYHLVFGAVARCWGSGAWYWSEEGAGWGLDVLMHESYGGGINTVRALHGRWNSQSNACQEYNASLYALGIGIADPPCLAVFGAAHQGASGDRVFPLTFAPTMNMPDPNNIGVSAAIKARIYSEGLSGDSWGLSVFNMGEGAGGYDEYIIPAQVRTQLCVWTLAPD